jgi:hypothetical protein
MNELQQPAIQPQQGDLGLLNLENLARTPHTCRGVTS